MYTNIAILQASKMFLLETQKDNYSTKRDKLLKYGCTETYIDTITSKDGKSIIGKMIMFTLDAFRLTATDSDGKFKVLHIGSHQECEQKKNELMSDQIRAIAAVRLN